MEDHEWLVDELYERYLADPGSVDKAWWSFFADYRPTYRKAEAEDGWKRMIEWFRENGVA